MVDDTGNFEHFLELFKSFCFNCGLTFPSIQRILLLFNRPDPWPHGRSAILFLHDRYLPCFRKRVQKTADQLLVPSQIGQTQIESIPSDFAAWTVYHFVEFSPTVSKKGFKIWSRFYWKSNLKRTLAWICLSTISTKLTPCGKHLVGSRLTFG